MEKTVDLVRYPRTAKLPSHEETVGKLRNLNQSVSDTITKLNEIRTARSMIPRQTWVDLSDSLNLLMTVQMVIESTIVFYIKLHNVETQG